MSDIKVYVYRSVEFDGNVYVKTVGVPSGQQCEITLYKDGKALASSGGEVAVFNGQSSGRYMATVNLTAPGGTLTTFQSSEVSILPVAKMNQEKVEPTTKATKETYSRYKGIDHYYLQVKLENENDVDRLRQEVATRLPLFFKVKDKATYKKVASNKLLGDILPNTYYIDPHSQFDDLVSMAKELEQLDYVIYCSVVPDTTDMPPPELPPRDSPTSLTDKIDKTSTTPDFQPLQTYLQPGSNNIKGMNVLPAWQQGEVGRAATVRHLDFGVYRNHEDLKGNITVVNSRPETEDSNHGTASTGCIAASKNSFGVTGIAYGCDYYFYDTGDLGLIVRDAMPGDVVSLDIQFDVGGKLLPVIHSRGWWDLIMALTRKGVVVVLAAGNGGLDLSPAAGNMDQFGDSGGTLVGACYHSSGERVYFSNYNHPTSRINSWGDWSVVTTGYGSLQRKPGNDRNYANDYAGTSSATPLSSGALALIQSYAIAKFGIYLNASGMRTIISDTGYSEGVGGKIGHRPNVDAAIAELFKLYNKS